MEPEAKAKCSLVSAISGWSRSASPGFPLRGSTHRRLDMDSALVSGLPVKRVGCSSGWILGSRALDVESWMDRDVDG